MNYDSIFLTRVLFICRSKSYFRAGDKRIQTREIEIDLKTAKVTVTEGACSRFIDLNDEETLEKEVEGKGFS